MALWGDDRGAAVQVGVAILLAFVVLAITTYQVEVVPNQNEEIEFDHNQEVQNQLQELRGDVISVSDGNSGGSQSITLGTGYPARTIFINPGPAAGILQTTDPGDGTIELEDARVDADDGTEDYWDGERTWEADTRALEYDIRYNVYQNAPVTVLEHSALYNDNPNDAKTTVADQLLVEDGELTIITLDGELRESRVGSASVRTRALSRTTNTVSVTPDGPEMTLTIPTDRTDFWGDELEAELGDNAVDADEAEDEVRITLEESYDLRMAKVGVGDVNRGSPDQRAEYVVADEEQSSPVIAEVRDEFNNPVANAEIQFERDTDSESTTTTTNSNGQVRIRAQGADEIEVWIDADNFDEADSFERQSIDVSAAGGGNAVGAYDVVWDTDEIEAANDNVDCPNGCTVTAASPAPTFSMFTDPDVDGAEANFAVSDQSVATFNPQAQEITDGTAETTFEIEGDDGDEVTAFVSSGGDGDQLGVTFDFEQPEGPFFAIDIISTNSPVSEDNDLEVQIEVENTGEEFDEQTVALETAGDERETDTIDLDPGESTQTTLTWSTSDGDAGDYQANVTGDGQGDGDQTPVIVADFNSANVEDLPNNEENVDQDFSFNLGGTLPAGNTTTITTDAADDVDYSDATIDEQESTLAGGSASLSVSGDTLEITYTANEAVDDETQINILVEGVNTASGSRTFDVIFTRNDSGASTEVQFENNP